MHRMTVQVVSAAGDAAMLLTAAVTGGLLVAAAVQLVRGRSRPATRLLAVLAGVLLVYGAVLVGTGLSGGAVQLRPGDMKCFDDWCAAMTGAHRDPAAGRLVVDVRVENRARRQAMRSDLAGAYVEVPGRGRVAAVDGGPLHVFLQPGDHADVQLTFDAASATRFVVDEGAGSLGPGTFEIGGEGSPFHGSAGGPLPAGAS